MVLKQRVGQFPILSSMTLYTEPEHSHLRCYTLDRLKMQTDLKAAIISLSSSRDVHGPLDCQNWTVFNFLCSNIPSRCLRDPNPQLSLVPFETMVFTLHFYSCIYKFIYCLCKLLIHYHYLEKYSSKHCI